jgi:hypothetical protein
MGGINPRAVYQFDPENYESQDAGGVLGLLQAVMQQSQAQPGADSSSTPNDANSYGSPHGGLLGRLAALQAEQNLYQPFAGSDGQTPPGPRDPNFRQVSRAPIAIWPQGAMGSSSRGDDQSSAAGGASQNPMQSAAPVSDGLSGAYGDKSASPSIAGSPTMKTAQLILPGRGIPVPPVMPVPLPPIPVPAIPDWWRDAWKILQLYPRISSGGGGGRRNDREDCIDRHEAEEDRCYARKQDYADWDFLSACRERAANRRNMCSQNGGQPDPSEPSEWGLADEEIWRNFRR